MHRLCLVVTAFCSLLLGYAEPHAGVFQASSANSRALRLSETTTDRRRLKSHLSGENTPVVVPPTSVMSDTTDGKSGISEERAPWDFAPPKFLLPDYVLEFANLVHLIVEAPPSGIYKKYGLSDRFVHRRSLPLWLTHVRTTSTHTFSSEEALDLLMTTRGSVEVVKLLLPYRKDKGIDTVVNEILKLAIFKCRHNSDNLPAMLLRQEVSAAEAFDLFGLSSNDALAKVPDLAITWLKFTELLRKRRTFYFRTNPLFVSKEASVDLLIGGKKSSAVNAFIKKVAKEPDLKDLVRVVKQQLAKHGDGELKGAKRGVELSH